MLLGVELKALIYEVAEGVALVTLNRPDRMNAWTARMEAEYHWALGTADADADVRVIVVTGAGRGFCPGADMGALDQIIAAGDYDVALGADAAAGSHDAPMPPPAGNPDWAHIFSRTLGIDKPVIAAVNGAAAGVGFVLMAFCDIRFAAAGAKFTTSFARLGLPAEHGVSWILSRIVGTGRAAELLYSSRVFTAEDAATMGLVNKVLPPEELLPFALDYARTMAAELAPVSLRMMKRQLVADLSRSLDASATEAERVMRVAVTEPAFAEGVAAFQAKRAPMFEGVTAGPPLAPARGLP